MEFREYYLGVLAKIRYYSHTETYIGDIDFPEAALRFQAGSYEELQQILRAEVEDYLSGNAALDGKQSASAQLERVAILSHSKA